MRAVLDTNVVVSGLLAPAGTCGQIVDLLLEGEIDLCLDGRILAEYEEVLKRKELSLPVQDVEKFLDYVKRSSETIVSRPLGSHLPDPDDLPFLEVAAAAATVLVTGNLRHYPAGQRGEVRVLSPRDFLSLLGLLDG